MATFVLNPRYGSFELSYAALKRLGWCLDARYLVLETVARSDPKLVRVCKELGEKASADGKPFEFVVVAASDIPYVKLSEYDGWECLTIDKQGKDIDNQARILTAIRAIMTTHISDAKKLSIIATLIK